MKRKLFILFAISVAATTILAACAPREVVKTVVVTEIVEGEVVEKVITATPEVEEVPAEEEVVLRIYALPWPQIKYEQELAEKYFTPKTGIKVVWDTPAFEWSEVTALQLWANKSDLYDIWEYDSQWIGEMVAAGALERLDTPEYLGAEDATIKLTDFLDGFTPRMSQYPINEVDIWKYPTEHFAGVPVYGIPWAVSSLQLVYRTDLFIEAGIVDAEGNPTPPNTWDEVVEYAKKLTNPPEVYGFCTLAGRTHDNAIHGFFPFLYSWDGLLWDEERWVSSGVVNSPEAVEALTYMVDNFFKSGIMPPDTANYSLGEVMNGLWQGKCAMAPWWNLFITMVDDPTLSTVVGKIGVTILPGRIDPETGELVRGNPFGNQGMGISAFSKNKQAAWEYIQWYTSYETQKELITMHPGFGGSGRKDLAEWAVTVGPTQKLFYERDIYETNIHDFWNTPDYAELLNIMQVQLHLAYTGKVSPQKALDDAAIMLDAVYEISPWNPHK